VTARHELEQLLSLDPDKVRADAERAWPALVGRGRSVVLHGAGGLGERMLAAMRVDGADAVAFSDNSSARQGTVVAGLPVLAPADAVKRFPGAIFVITIWGANSPHRQAQSREQLRALGAVDVVSFPVVGWHHRGALPHYLVDMPDAPLRAALAVREAFELFADESSRQEFVDQLRLRITGSFDHLRGPAWHPQYYPPDIVDWRAGEIVVDGGAYDGDSLRSWTGWRGADFARWIAAEPDPANLERLRATCAALGADVAARVIVLEVALTTRHGEMRFSATGTAGAAAVASGSVSASTSAATATTVVRTAPLDALVANDAVSFIKLDIEGGELDALTGAAATIARARPVLAICAYHLQDHLWRVPLLCSALLSQSRIVLRPHNEEGWDLVCYAVPEERWKQPAEIV